MKHLIELVESHCEAISGKPFFWPNEIQTIYLIKQGGIDCFIQERESNGEPKGHREYIFRAEKNQFFPGFKCKDDEVAVIAVPLPDTLFYKVDIPKVIKALCTPEIKKEFIHELNTWIKITTDRHIDQLPPKIYTAIGPFDKIDVPKNTAISASYGIRWINIKEGSFSWVDKPELAALNNQSAAIPLSARLWLRSLDDARIETIDIEELLCSEAIWESIFLHYQLLLQHIQLKNSERIKLEMERLGTKTEQSCRLVNKAFAQIMSVISDQIESPVLQDSKESNMAALTLIGDQINVQFSQLSIDKQLFKRDPLAAIAAEAMIRYRRVALKGDWWTTDNGPLLSHYDKTDHWVALLPKGSGQYELHDPAKKEIVLVTQEVALTLDPFATSFYRPFPDQSIKPLDLLFFGAQGMKSDIITVLLIGLFTGLLGTVMPIATGKIVESIIPSGNRMDLWAMGGALVATIMAISLIGLTRSIAVLRIESKMNNIIQAAVWDRVLKLPVSFFRQFTAGDLATRINGINAIRQALSGATVTTIMGGIFSIFNYFLLFHYSTQLAIVATILVFIAISVVVIIGLIKLRYERLVSEANGKLTGTVFEYLSGIAKIRVSAAENQAFFNWSTRFAYLRTLRFKSLHLANIETVFFSGYSVITSAVLFSAMGMMLTSHADTSISTGEFIAFNAAFGLFFGGLMTLSRTALGLLNLVPIYERVKPILESIPEVSESKIKLEDLQGWIEVSKLNFHYKEGIPIISEVSFTIQPGEFVALVGPSGSGKSTLLRLLLGFEKAVSGSIKYDTQDISDIDLNTLRRQLGVVLQSGQLITGDIFSNIVGSSSLAMDDAWKAARMVGMEEDIRLMPMGMQTLISEGASTLSVGQRQRILIARAIITRPRVLFFDEATSSLDNKTQAIVAKSLEALKASRITIAHRLSTIIHADQILVLDKGRIVQKGNYNQLIEEQGIFQELVKRQMI